MGSDDAGALSVSGFGAMDGIWRCLRWSHDGRADRTTSMPGARGACELVPAIWVLPVTPGCSLIVPHLLSADVPDPVAEEGPVNGKSTHGSDDEDRQ